MTAEVTRLVPTAVKVRREPSGPIKMKPRMMQSIQYSLKPSFFLVTFFLFFSGGNSILRDSTVGVSATPSQPIQRSKDDAYDQFMREVGGLL